MNLKEKMKSRLYRSSWSKEEILGLNPTIAKKQTKKQQTNKKTNPVISATFCTVALCLGEEFEWITATSDV